MRRVPRFALAALATAAALAGCGTIDVQVGAETDIGKVGVETDAALTTTTTAAVEAATAAVDPAIEAASSTTTSSTTTTTSTVAPTNTAAAASTTTSPPPTTTTTAAPTTTIALEYNDTGFGEFGVAIDLPLYFPAARYEHIGFHQSGHDGSRQVEVTGAADWRTLEDRGRGTGSRTAADIVVPPDATIYAPVSGTVVRTGSYVLYCDHTDNFVVIDPDGHPGWEVKMFHFEGLAVAVGDRVEAGVTVVGSNARVLPFVSQVDEFTAEPSNPHVHVEVIDPSIPDKPSAGGGC